MIFKKNNQSRRATASFIIMALLMGFGIMGLRFWVSKAELSNVYVIVIMKSSTYDTAKVYYDLGGGLSEKDSTGVPIIGDQHFHEYRFKIPKGVMGSFRFDPLTNQGSVTITKMEIVNGFGRRLGSVDLHQLRPSHQIKKMDIREDRVTIITEDKANDPQISVSWSSPVSSGYLNWAFFFFALRMVMEFFAIFCLIVVVKFLFVRRNNLFEYSYTMITFFHKLNRHISQFISNRYATYLVEIILKAKVRYSKYLTDRNILIFLISFSILFGFILLRHNLDAKWSIIDDHEIMHFLGSDRNIPFNEIPKLIFQTEIGSYGDSLRYRPSYYVLRIFETFLWGDNPQLWYAARILFLIIFLFVVSSLVTKQLGVFIAVPFTIFIMTGNYWPDILTRLGPSEIYAVPGIALYAYGLYQIMNTTVIRKVQVIHWLSFFIGGMIAIG